MGDFNNVLQSQDITSGNLVHEAEHIDLVNMIDKTGLLEKVGVGDHFTWFNKQTNGSIYSIIIRVIVNMEWHQQNMETILKII